VIADRDSVIMGNAATPALRVDFAGVFHDHLLVYGWIFGLFHDVTRAEIKHADVVIDLMSLAIPVPRPDVTQHFVSQLPATDDNHGFCLMVALPDGGSRPSYLRLAVALRSGQTVERAWPVEVGDHNVLKFFENNQYIFNWLLQNLPGADATRLRALSSAGLHAVPDRPGSSRALQLPFGVDECCLLQGRLLVIAGWVGDEDRSLTGAEVKVGASTVNFLAEMSEFPYPAGNSQVQSNLRGGERLKRGISAVVTLPTVVTGMEAVFDVCAHDKQMRVRREIAQSVRHSYPELAALFARLDADTALSLMERIAARLDPSDGWTLEWLTTELGKAVARLPIELQNHHPRALLHVDTVTPVAEAGIFLNGWYSADSEVSYEIACHRGFTRSRIDDGWVRMIRLDVASHLVKEGLGAPDPTLGFVCYVPLPGQAASYLSLTDASGSVRRMRITIGPPASSPLQGVRTLLTSFYAGHRELRTLLRRHIGPAVTAVWDRRAKPQRKPVIHRFGPEPPDPQVSVIVPLFGRYDFAEYQMALFADDADFQSVELIYFVDDPAIYDEFKAQCPDLFEIYRVPFTIVFAGTNLGFAGANNSAAAIASGKQLLLLNSDVMPKRPGWLGDLVDLYRTLDKPGLLGAKLLYEDGSIQHAGMTFRRHPGWDGMWINEHLQKGQSPHGLSGLRRVDAVTAACVLVETALYRKLGGLSEDFIIGDFEDSDFCLRAEAAGRRHYVTLDVELYHLERQSQDRIGDAHWRTNLTLYNCWLHDQRWAAYLEQKR
jgi:GT2 family glycosyltransferase